MIDQLLQKKVWVNSLLGFIVSCAWIGVWMESWVIWALPLIIVTAWVTIYRYDVFYYLVIALIPFSVEILFTGGIGTDLPTEPLMILLSVIFVVFAIYNSKFIKDKILFHPLTWILILHMAWLCLTMILSQNLMVSLKFLLAKSWYITAFFLMTLVIIRHQNQWRKAMSYLVVTMVLAALYVMVRQAGTGFAFSQVNFIVGPFFRNHVNYGSLICAVIPFAWALFKLNNKTWKQIFYLGLLLFLLIAMYFSYTRATYVAIFVGLLVAAGMRLRILKWLVLCGLVGAVLFVVFMVTSNRYLDYAPDYDKTISHDEFENLIGATARGEDISTMERVYRWVAGMHMVSEKPVFGFGPGNFYFFYKPFAVSSFRTYVSNNPDKSGIHSYYLMTAVEQGIPGLFIFIGLIAFFLLRIEKAYHHCPDRNNKIILVSTLVSFTNILTILLLNDMLETDKVGPIFFFCIGVLVWIDRNHPRYLLK